MLEGGKGYDTMCLLFWGLTFITTTTITSPLLGFRFEVFSEEVVSVFQ